MPRKKLTPQQAKALLIADGVDFSQDFHSQDSYVVGRLEELVKAAGYRKSKNAPGSTVRMFYQYLSRVAPVVHAPGQLTPAERRAYQARARARRSHSTKKSPAQLEREIAEALSKSGKGQRPSKLGGDYFTVVLTRAKPESTNEWNRLPVGWDAQTSGAFPSKYAAYKWAREKLLPGAPFTIRYVPLGQ